MELHDEDTESLQSNLTVGAWRGALIIDDRSHGTHQPGGLHMLYLLHDCAMSDTVPTEYVARYSWWHAVEMAHIEHDHVRRLEDRTTQLVFHPARRCTCARHRLHLLNVPVCAVQHYLTVYS